jgi:hypothetical protein
VAPLGELGKDQLDGLTHLDIRVLLDPPLGKAHPPRGQARPLLAAAHTGKPAGREALAQHVKLRFASHVPFNPSRSLSL